MVDAMFKGGKYDIPIRFEKDDMKGEIGSLLTSYIEDLKANGASPETIKRVEAFRRSCATTMRNYLNGIHSLAYDNFAKAVANLGIESSPLLVTQLSDDHLFRGRINSGNENNYDDGEMFHIPLDRRGIVSSQRYSFPGLPCLYFGASVYTCWMEMGQPSFDVF